MSIVIMCFLLRLSICLAQEVHFGESCVPNNYYPEGTCTLLSECDLALRQTMIRKSHNLKRCVSEDTTEVVCCPREPDSIFGTSFTTKTPVTVSERIAVRECKNFLDSPFCQSSTKILGGVVAGLGEFPHMVALGFDRGDGYIFDCGGSVISKDFVLTAAHCVTTLDGIEPTIVRTGVVEIGGKTFNSETDVTIAEIIKHPDWRRKTSYHDLALLRLNKSLSFSSKLNAACLETSNSDPTLPLVITGWGKTSMTQDAKSAILLKTTVSFVPTTKCNESFINMRRLPRGIVVKQLCAGDLNKDTCEGDSGGPLQTKIAEKILYRIVGITSFGRGCGSAVPGVYTRVAKYLDWIESVVWPQN